MSLTYGFHNSLNHDRVYNAEEISSIFDGLVNDGVYGTYKESMTVRSAEGMKVVVKPGRAWFNHTWTYIDSDYSVELDPSQPIVSRIDAICLTINRDKGYRKNYIEVIKGAPSTSPSKPAVSSNPSAELYRYPLGYVTINADAVSISQSNIENAVGTSACPFVTGLVQMYTIDQLLIQWRSQFDEWNDKQKNEFLNWFDNLKYVLDGDVAGHLQNEIDAIKDGSGVLVIDSDGYIAIDYDKVKRG